MMDSKAVWDDVSTEIFINACLDQIYRKERRGLSFSKVGWNAIVQTFNEKTGKSYDKKQLKNRMDILKKDLRTWDSLTKETGVGRDPLTNNVVASNDWWKQKCQEHSAYKKFRRSSLKFERELRIIFKDVMATGEDIFSPSFAEPQTQEAARDDVYIPTMDEEEGSGDSEDDLFGANPVGSTGVTDEFGSIGLSTMTPPSDPADSGSHGKRKGVDRPFKRKKQKIPASRQIADAVSAIATTSKERNATLEDLATASRERNTALTDIANASKERAALLSARKDVSVDAVMTELIELEEMQCDELFRVRCIKLLMDQASREMFVSLKWNKRYLVEWLRYMVNDP